MFILVEVDNERDIDHNEKRRLLFTELYFNWSRHGSYSLDGRCDEVHPATAGDEGYHCPYCHKDIKPSSVA